MLRAAGPPHKPKSCLKDPELPPWALLGGQLWAVPLLSPQLICAMLPALPCAHPEPLLGPALLSSQSFPSLSPSPIPTTAPVHFSAPPIHTLGKVFKHQPFVIFCLKNQHYKGTLSTVTITQPAVTKYIQKIGFVIPFYWRTAIRLP